MLMRFAASICIAGAGAMAAAQNVEINPPAAPDTAAPDEVPPETGNEAPDANAPRPPGDIVYMKNGESIAGLQIVRENSMSVVLDVLNGTVTIEVPRRQIDRIDYDGIDPNSPEASGDSAEMDARSTLLEAQRLSPEMQRLLAVDISSPPLIFAAPTDFLEIVRQVNPRAGNAVTVDPSVEAIPAEDRLWTFETEEGMTLSMFLKDALLKDFGNLEMRYESDSILLTRKGAGDAPTDDAGETESGGESGSESTAAEESET